MLTKKVIEKIYFYNHTLCIDYPLKVVSIRSFNGLTMQFEFGFIVTYFLSKKEYINNCNMYVLVLKFCISKMRNDE